MQRKRVALPLAVVVGTMGLAGVSVSTASGTEEGALVPASVGVDRIYVPQRGYPAKGHSFTFEVTLDVCPTPLLEPDHATIVERPRIGAQKGVAIVTAYVRWPEHHELVEGESCPPLPWITKAMSVHTKRPASELIFFDGSSSPPRRIYPRGPALSGDELRLER